MDYTILAPSIKGYKLDKKTANDSSRKTELTTTKRKLQPGEIWKTIYTRASTKQLGVTSVKKYPNKIEVTIGMQVTTVEIGEKTQNSVVTRQHFTAQRKFYKVLVYRK